MKAGFLMLAGCALLSGCATRVIQAPQPIMARAAVVPKPIPPKIGIPIRQTNVLEQAKLALPQQVPIIYPANEVASTNLVPPEPALLPQTNEVDLTKQYIRISGEVVMPGFYPSGPTTRTLVRAISTAGSFSSFRSPSVLEVHRGNGSVEIYRLREIEQGRTNDPSIYPNDHIHVPRRNVVGW